MRRLLLLPALALALSACAAPREAIGTPPSSGETPSGAPAYETFDPAGYDAPPPPAAPVEVVHDVPPRLMQGRVDVPGRTDRPAGPRVVEGFRIQVFASDDRTAAERVRDEAQGWWAAAQNSAGAPDRFEAIVGFNRPNYVVRLFGFEFRDEAEAALVLVRSQFPEAYIVPDRVTLPE